MLQRVLSRYSIFCRNFFCLTVLKIFADNPCVLCFRKFPVAKKFMDKRGGEYQDYPSKIFCLTVPKIFAGESFTVSLISAIERVWIRVGGIRILRRIFLYHGAEKLRRGILNCCINFRYRKSLEKRGGGVSSFYVEIFCLTVRKNS